LCGGDIIVYTTTTDNGSAMTIVTRD